MFKKYTSIENSYRQKYILKAVGEYPELQKQKYIIQEKIDGSNLQLFFEPCRKMRVGKRSAFLKEDENFYDYQQTLNNYDFSEIQKFVELTGHTVRLFGELFGPGIQKRVIDRDWETS